MEHKFFGETTLPSISLIGAAAFKQLIDAGEEVYTINIQPTRDYQDIEALCVVSNTPAPMTALHPEPLPIDEAELFTKVVPKVYQDFFDVFSWEEAKNMPECWPWQANSAKIDMFDPFPGLFQVVLFTTSSLKHL